MFQGYSVAVSIVQSINCHLTWKTAGKGKKRISFVEFSFNFILFFFYFRLFLLSFLGRLFILFLPWEDFCRSWYPRSGQYYMIYWKLKCTERPFTKNISHEKLTNLAETRELVWHEFRKVPCHSKASKRHIELVFEVSSRFTTHERLRGHP